MEAAAIIDVLRDLAHGLETQVAGTRAVPGMIGRVDGVALQAYASTREESTAQLERLHLALQRGLSTLVAEGRIGTPTVAALAAARPDLAAQLRQGLQRVRAGAGELAQLDGRCRASASRAMSIVRAYAAVLRPVTRAYDYRGSAAQFEPTVIHSQRA